MNMTEETTTKVKKVIRLKKNPNIQEKTPESLQEGEVKGEKKRIQLNPKKIINAIPKNQKKKVKPTSLIKKGKQKKYREFSVKICTSMKSCGENYGPYIWERVCNEHNQPHDTESFVAKGITYKKSPCQGYCKRKSNVQVEDTNTEKKTQFHYMNPIKTAKLIKNIENGANPENIKRL